MAKRMTNEEFLQKVKPINLDKFEVVTDYKNSRTKIGLKCRECNNEWEQLPKPLMSRTIECPKCSGRGYTSSNYSEGAMTLYFLKISDKDDVYWKVGITKYEDVSERFTDEDMDKITVLKTIRFPDGKTCWEFEQALQEALSEWEVKGKKILRYGNTELYSVNPLEKIGMD